MDNIIDTIYRLIYNSDNGLTITELAIETSHDRGSARRCTDALKIKGLVYVSDEKRPPPEELRKLFYSKVHTEKVFKYVREA